MGCCGPQVIVSSVIAGLLGNADSPRCQQTSLTHPSSLCVVFHFFSISLFSFSVQTTRRHALSFIDTSHKDAFAYDFRHSETYHFFFFFLHTSTNYINTTALAHNMTNSFRARVIEAVPKHELCRALRNGAKRTRVCPAMCFFFSPVLVGKKKVKGGE